MGENVKLGHLESQGSKGHFHQKCSKSFILDSLTIRLMHIHYRKTLILCYGVKGQPGVIGVTGFKWSFLLNIP